MTNSVYVFRHSNRERHVAHLNQAGVTRARKVGERLGVFAQVYCSPAMRAIETAVAMGYAVTEERDELALPDGKALSRELDTIRRFEDAARLLRAGAHIPAYGVQLRAFVEEAVASLHDHNDLLMISHGGLIEVLALACCPSARAAQLEPELSFCDGVRLEFEHGVCIRVERWAANGGG
jgi:broad specificity phosphatase PhoE